MKQSSVMAFCGMMAAVSIVIMLLGAAIGIGAYAAPMFAGLILLPVGNKFGKKYHIMIWIAVSLLCLIFVPNIEQNLMYLALFGLYPILYPSFQRLPKFWRIVCKLLYFNTVILLLEWLVMTLLVPEALTAWMAVLLLVVGNLTFLMYDFLIPRMEIVIHHYLKKLKHHK